MKRSTTIAVIVTAFSTAAIAQVGTQSVENKNTANELSAQPTPTATPRPAVESPGSPASTAQPTTDDAPPSDRADAPASASPPPGDPVGASRPPPKR